MARAKKAPAPESGPLYVIEKRDMVTTYYLVVDSTFHAVRALYVPLIVAGVTYGVHDTTILNDYLPDGKVPRYVASERPLQSVLSELRQALRDHGGTPEAVRLLINLGALDEGDIEMAKAKLESKGAAKAAETAAPAKGKGGGKGNPEALKKAREAKETGPDTRKIKILNKENPYREGSNRAASFDALKGAKTVQDYKDAGGKVKYISRWVEDKVIELS